MRIEHIQGFRHSTVSMINNPARIPELDGLRGVAILLVLFFHYGAGFPRFTPGTAASYINAVFLRLGWSGVDLFFVLSGFLICSVLLRMQATADPRLLPTFYSRRAARTLPVYLTMLALFVAGTGAQRAGWINLPDMFGAVHARWPYFMMMQNNFYALNGFDHNFISPSWSLAIEEQFYLVFPLMFLGRRQIGILAIALAGSILCSVGMRAMGTMLPVPEPAWGYCFTLCRLDGLAVGALIAVLVATARPFIERHRVYIALSVPVLGAGLLIEAKWRGALGLFLFTWIAVFYGSILLLAVLSSSITAFLRARVLRFFGDISYSLYFIHLPVLAVCAAVFMPPDADLHSRRPIMCSFLAVVLSVGLAWLSRQHVERPAIEAVRVRLSRSNETEAFSSRSS